MLAPLTQLIVGFMDFLLGWLLRFPSDVQLIVVAFGSALLLTLIRRWTTDQGLLQRCRADKAQLQKLLREAKARTDRDAVLRHRATLGMIAMKQFRQEGRPLLASLLPIVLLATWAMHRLEFHPLKTGEPFQFTATFPISAVGKIAHIAPTDALTAESGWIQEITVSSPTHSIAVWRLTAQPGPALRQLQLRFGKQTFTHPIRADGRTYEAPLQTHDTHLLTTDLKLTPVRLFGLIPDAAWLPFPPWLIGYLILIIPLTFFLKKVLRVF